MEDNVEYVNRLIEGAYGSLNTADSYEKTLQRQPEVASELEDEIHSTRNALTRALATLYTDLITQLESPLSEPSVGYLFDVADALKSLAEVVYDQW